MKKYIFLISLFLCQISFAQDITNKRWKIKSSAIVSNTDTIYLFKNTQQNNRFELSKISYSFNSNSEYVGTSIDGSVIQGHWSQKIGQVEIDSVMSNFQIINASEFLISKSFKIRDTLGNTAMATSLLRFYYSPITDFEVLLFPNPFNNYLKAQITSPKRFNASIELTNAIGQIVYKKTAQIIDLQNNLSLDLSTLQNGVYFFTIKGDNIIETRKVIKL